MKHECKGSERILERNYSITGDIRGKRIIIVDDVFTSGQSLTDYKEEIERCGGEVVAAIFYGAAYTYIRPTTGAMPGIKAFTAAVFGGIGSIPGAMLGGVLLGVIEQLSKTYISTLWADAIVFGVLVAVLVVKPTGLLGKRISEKV